MAAPLFVPIDPTTTTATTTIRPRNNSNNNCGADKVRPAYPIEIDVPERKQSKTMSKN